MTDLTDLEDALFDLGMEDLIALPETLHVPETASLITPSRALERVTRALESLLRHKRIQVWSARWPDEPEIADPGSAMALLRNASQYEFNSPADRERRVYYVSADNLWVNGDGQEQDR